MRELKALRHFEFVDPEGRDMGINVREKAKEVIEAVADQTKSMFKIQLRATGQASRPPTSGGIIQRDAEAPRTHSRNIPRSLR